MWIVRPFTPSLILKKIWKRIKSLRRRHASASNEMLLGGSGGDAKRQTVVLTRGKVFYQKFQRNVVR
jgi:hypothetical protein